jgi:transposase
MVVLGIDPHKRTHTVVAVDDTGRQLGQLTVGAQAEELLRLLCWADQFTQRRWAVEDCRHVAGALLRLLLSAGQSVVMVPPKLMARARASARTRGKSDPIDALAVARAALREPDLPRAQLDEPALELKLLLDHREDLVAERTRMINRLRWHLHDLGVEVASAAQLNRLVVLAGLRERLGKLNLSVRVEIALELVEQIVVITRRAAELRRRISKRVAVVAPTLLELPGCAGLTAAKITAETAGITRFRSSAAFAMHAGTAPIPVWTGNHPRYRLNRGGNRQLNAALHRIAVTQLRVHPPARALIDRRIASGDSKTEAIRILRRHLADVVYHRLKNAAASAASQQPTAA